MRDTAIRPSRGLFVLAHLRWMESWTFREPVFSSESFSPPSPQNQNRNLLTRNGSSWLGGGSEFLIASAFEVGPPVIFSPPNQGSSTSESETLPKVTTAGPLVEDEDDGGEAAATTTTFRATPIPKAVKKGKDKKKNKSNDSPLAKLFGRPTFSASPEETITILKDRDVNRGKQVEMVEQAVSEKEGGDIEQLKKEIESMRQSQLRMEEMLAGFLAGKSA